MSDRKAVVLLMFDLPMTTPASRSAYYHFKKALRLQGFLPLQESCYIKLLRNASTLPSAIREIQHSLPREGTVHILPLSQNQFSEMHCLCGKPFEMDVFSGDLFIIGEEEEKENAG